MYIAGRWVSLDMVNTIFILWAVAAALLGIVDWWLSRPPAAKSSEKEAVTRRRRGNRRKR